MAADKTYLYTVIIPHRNIPELLERCLASIPRREDVQVVIVDDNSDPTIVNFSRFPGLGRPHTEVVFTKGGGPGNAGRARNVGMEVAKGRWLLLADADDFFHPAIDGLFDRYADSDADMVFFRHDSVDSETLEPVGINTSRNRYLDEFEQTGDEDDVRFMIWVPWARFIRRSMVASHGLGFEEVRLSNNLLFSVKAGHAAGKILSDPTVAYCNVRRANSLIHEGRSDWEAMSQRFDTDYKAAQYLISIGEGRIFDKVVADRWLELSRLDRRKARKLLPRLREVCSTARIRRLRFDLFAERMAKPFRKKK